MTLAARCPSCGTVFRVVQDQLRVSDGWVRCGRCGEVFNAIQNLVELDVDTARPEPQEADIDTAAAPASPADFSARDDDDDDDLVVEPHEDTVVASRYDDAPGATRPHEEPVFDVGLDTMAAPQPASAAPGATPDEPPLEPPAAPRAADTVAEERADSTPAPQPAFLRRAEREARWRRPGVRAALAACCLLGTAALGAQATFEYRDLVVARWPGTAPLVMALCHAPACTIEAPRAIEGLSVESSGLVRLEGTAMYQLQLLLRNRSALPLAVPALDLTLSDSRGGTVARRIITPAEAGIAAPAVQPAAEMPIQITLSAAGRPIAGYTIEIFYP
ncbi:zinc-ribbon and DUF3426 domain-containing protein [Rubrivivax gelatinosus]|uniref:Zinc finger/thioredoxin putative domain-containing protein n=1 Tax=Rubrivivax gelatinosus TaxID=28068 RepID=A0ABS1DTF4_RUBGE|nr:zinc-ribbon and DUF3426 domain-containing protein [Rubrivivax gelatinosus]MBK1712624.1 hypothetical protein [Rubrivivax gelatinosus]